MCFPGYKRIWAPNAQPRETMISSYAVGSMNRRLLLKEPKSRLSRPIGYSAFGL